MALSLQSLLGGNSGPLVGLDISSSAIKLVELSRRGNGFAVESYAVEPLPPGAVADKQINEPDNVSTAIERVLARAGTRTRGAAVAVAGPSVISRIIQLPSGLTEAEMEEQIRNEADQYVPYPIDEVNLDFQVLGMSTREIGAVDVLLVACRTEQVDARAAVLEAAGVKPRVVDVETYALENACRLLVHQMPAGGRGKTVSVVDIGASTTSMIVLHDLELVFSRDQAFGGRQLTEDIMRHYGLSFEEAGKAKRTNTLPDGYRAEVLDPFLNDLAQQIDRSLQFFFSSHSQYGAIDQLILAGGCAHIPNIEREIHARLQIPTAVAQPMSQMQVNSRAKPQALARDEASLLIACGLALRAFDP